MPAALTLLLLLAAFPAQSQQRSEGETVAGLISEVPVEFVWIPAGEFLMGCSPGDEDCGADETAHPVRIRQAFEIGKQEVTQALWEAVMGPDANKSEVIDPALPVDTVSWDQAAEFLQRVNAAADDGYTYRLPSEAEWEYAARAGMAGPRHGPLDMVAWHTGNADRGSHPTGTKLFNTWGLHDVLGNVAEWCSDWYDPDYYVLGTSEDPGGPETGDERVVRGGGWTEDPEMVRVSSRASMPPDGRSNSVGFRLVRVR